MPETVMRRIFRETNLKESADYGLLVSLLTTYQRQGELRSWDGYRAKISPQLLKLWGDILIECRRNGFIAPRAAGDKIVFRQVVSSNKHTGDLCTMCNRDCRRREQIDTGVMREIKKLNKNNPHWSEPKPCWEAGGA